MVKMQIRLRCRWLLALGVFLAGAPFAWTQSQSHPVVVRATKHAIAPPLSQMAPLPVPSSPTGMVTDDDRLVVHRTYTTRPVQDAVLQGSRAEAALAGLTPLSSNPGLNFLGLGTGFGGYADQANVPDTNLAVGPTQVVQWVNESFAVFNKSDGSVAYAPANGSTLWQRSRGTVLHYHNLDEIVQFDKLANRWVMLMPTSLAPRTCVLQSRPQRIRSMAAGISMSSRKRRSLSSGCSLDGLSQVGGLAGWLLRQFQPGFERYSTILGAGVCVRPQQHADGCCGTTMQCFSQTGTNYGFMLPADLDGTTPSPTGSPEYFLNFDGDDQSLDLWQFHVDWTTPTNSTFTGPTSIPVAAFTEACGETVVKLNYTTGDCIPQAGTPQTLDSFGDRLMYRLAYRNFGTHESLVANHTVQLAASSTQTGIRWYELQNTGLGFGVLPAGNVRPGFQLSLDGQHRDGRSR